MRDSNFSFPALGRACICLSSGIYDRRALDAPPGSLPLVNSLTHLTYLTATSPRVRDIISHDGGLERLVRILQHCARGSPANGPAASLADYKGKGKARARPRGPRQSPFKAFAEYDLLPTPQELVELEEADVDGALLAKSGQGGSFAGGYTYSIPSSLLLPASSTSKYLSYTYSLAFQCIVNIGVRGSEAIRTRVVEAGALDVVVFVLERYLADVQRKRVQNQVDWLRGERGGNVPMRDDSVDSRRQSALGTATVAPRQTMQAERRLDRLVPVSDASSPASSAPVSPIPPASPSSYTLPHITVPPSAISRPLLTRLNVVAASSAAASNAEGVLQLPTRVHTPDTVASSMDEASSLTGDENGSASGQEQDGDEVMAASSSSSSIAVTAVGEAVPLVAVVKMNAVPVSAQQDAEGDVVMEDGSSTPDQPEPRPRQHRPRPPISRAHTMPQPLPHGPAAPAAASPAVSATPTSPPVPEADGALHFRDEDILLSLQLLAYLSKYPHVRSLFHTPSAALVASACARTSAPSTCSMHARASARTSRRAPLPPTNVFSLVELFTYHPPADDPFTPRHPIEVQYWAGVIMRNACRKDEAQSGIRQCANMRCGKWEVYAREFAKCRRCRRAKYCSKACQSEAWNQGHRYWCHKGASRRDSGTAAPAHGSSSHGHGPTHDRAAALANAAGNDSGASGSSAPASPVASGVATPTGDVPPIAAGANVAELFGLVPPVPTPGAARRRPHAVGSAQRRPQRRRGGDDEDEDDELEDDDVLALGSGTMPRASQGAHRHHGAQTPPAHEPGPTALGERAPPPFGGLNGMGMFELAGHVGDRTQGVVAIDEDQVARDMLALGADEGGAVRVQA